MNSPDTFSTEDLQSLQATVERFARQAIAPHVPEWEEAGQIDRTLYTQAAQLACWVWATPNTWAARPHLGAHAMRCRKRWHASAAVAV
jgi:Acyl-CoA dehydrogenase, N-terminal domain